MRRHFLQKFLRKAFPGRFRGKKEVPGHVDALYWDPAFADALANWGENHVWPEIKALLAGRQGRVLDIACGSGEALIGLQPLAGLELYGFDFSDFLINRAAEHVQSRACNPADQAPLSAQTARHPNSEKRGPSIHLLVGNATHFPFPDKSFDYSYSIGSLEHFSEGDIARFLEEASHASPLSVLFTRFRLPWARTKDGFPQTSRITITICLGGYLDSKLHFEMCTLCRADGLTRAPSANGLFVFHEFILLHRSPTS